MSREVEVEVSTISDHWEQIFDAIVKRPESKVFKDMVENPNFTDQDKFISSFFLALGQAVFNDFTVDAIEHVLTIRSDPDTVNKD